MTRKRSNRPDIEMGYEGDEAYYIRHMTDGTTTLVQIVYRHPYDGPTILGQGISKRAKGDTRNGLYGSSLAFERAHLDAAKYYRRAQDVALNGTLSTQMQEMELKVLGQERKRLAEEAKDVRRFEARKRFANSDKGRGVLAALRGMRRK